MFLTMRKDKKNTTNDRTCKVTAKLQAVVLKLCRVKYLQEVKMF